MNPLTDKRRAEIREMLAEITQDEWHLNDPDIDYWTVDDINGQSVVGAGRDGEVTVGIEDARFIAASPQIVRELLDHIALLECNTVPTLEMIRDELSLQIDFWKGIATGELDYAPEDIGDWLEHKPRPSVAKLEAEIKLLKVQRDAYMETEV